VSTYTIEDMKKKKIKYVKDPTPRHRCSKCGKVRYEKKMRKLEPRESGASSQFNNNEKQWTCREHDQLQIIEVEIPKKIKKRKKKISRKSVKQVAVDKSKKSFFQAIKEFRKKK
jgi:hypothetical protein